MSQESLKNTCRVLVLDIQPIDPPVGGGRLRLLGLYHALGPALHTTYVGTYDWPGEKFRKHRLNDSLVEINIPLSDEHFSTVKEWEGKAGGKTVIDTTFHQLAYLSEQFVKYARNEVAKADIVIFSHPWVYPVVRDRLQQQSQLIIYDSHNFEGLLRTTLLDDEAFGTEIVKEGVRIEYELCHLADLVLACSHEDLELFHRIYHVPYSKVRIVPNGAFTKSLLSPTAKEKKKAKANLGLKDRKSAIFLGSLYGPNLEAAKIICGEVAPKLPEITFVICGGVCDGISKKDIENRTIKNIHLAGFVSEEDKLCYLQASDIALNPMTSGSGTNIKMFDFFAAGLPTIATPIGARGIEQGNEQVFIVCNQNDLADTVRRLVHDSKLQEQLSGNARRFVEDNYAWERISPKLGTLVKRWYIKKNQRPFFSVIIPSYERHDSLSGLMKRLAKQCFKNFEVIIIDQSRNAWTDKDTDFGIDILYLHTDIKGAVKARNTGCFYATGDIIAFTDDDCEPGENWLFNAKKYFDKGENVGIEGLIKSDKLNDPMYRTVCNEGFEGFGFMTANLFLRLEIFNAANGFDEDFDNPHFREDTDLAWRALDYGEIPFARDVEVFHPPHPRSIERESGPERARFFEKDALLLKKHPDKYKVLFTAEGHGEKTSGFWENFLRGARKYGVDVPEFYLSLLPNERNMG